MYRARRVKGCLLAVVLSWTLAPSLSFRGKAELGRWQLCSVCRCALFRCRLSDEGCRGMVWKSSSSELGWMGTTARHRCRCMRIPLTFSHYVHLFICPSVCLSAALSLLSIFTSLPLGRNKRKREPFPLFDP